jgi:hypothetical protein
MLAGVRNDVEARLRTIARRASVQVFTAAFAKATLVVAATGATLALVARFFGHATPPIETWPYAAIPPFLYAAYRTYALRPSNDGAAAYLDRRAGFGGLLLSLRETEGGEAWAAKLAARAATAPPVAPKVGRRVDLVRVVGAALLIAAVAILPAPSAPKAATHHPAIAAAVEELRRSLEELKRKDALDEKSEREIERRIEAVEERMREGRDASWSEIDAIDSRMEEALEMRRDATEAAAEAFDSVASAKPENEDQNREAFAEALKKAGAFGSLENLPSELRERLERATENDSGASDPSASSLSAEELQALAADLSKFLSGELGDLEAAGLGDPDAAAGEVASGEVSSGEFEEIDSHEHDDACEGGT